jgi:hypothetical protein
MLSKLDAPSSGRIEKGQIHKEFRIALHRYRKKPVSNRFDLLRKVG